MHAPIQPAGTPAVATSAPLVGALTGTPAVARPARQPDRAVVNTLPGRFNDVEAGGPLGVKVSIVNEGEEDRGTTYEWTGLWSTELRYDDCPLFTDRGETGAGTLDSDVATPQQVHVSADDVVLAGVRLGADMVHPSTKQSSCDGSESWEDDVAGSGNLHLARTSWSRNSMTFTVDSWRDTPSRAEGGWDSVTGTLRLT